MLPPQTSKSSNLMDVVRNTNSTYQRFDVERGCNEKSDFNGMEESEVKKQNEVKRANSGHDNTKHDGVEENCVDKTCAERPEAVSVKASHYSVVQRKAEQRSPGLDNAKSHHLGQIETKRVEAEGISAEHSGEDGRQRQTEKECGAGEEKFTVEGVSGEECVGTRRVVRQRNWLEAEGTQLRGQEMMREEERHTKQGWERFKGSVVRSEVGRHDRQDMIPEWEQDGESERDGPGEEISGGVRERKARNKERVTATRRRLIDEARKGEMRTVEEGPVEGKENNVNVRENEDQTETVLLRKRNRRAFRPPQPRWTDYDLKCLRTAISEPNPTRSWKVVSERLQNMGISRSAQACYQRFRVLLNSNDVGLATTAASIMRYKTRKRPRHVSDCVDPSGETKSAEDINLPISDNPSLTPALHDSSSEYDTSENNEEKDDGAQGPQSSFENVALSNIESQHSILIEDMNNISLKPHHCAESLCDADSNVLKRVQGVRSSNGAPVVSLTDVGKSASLLHSAQAALPLNDANLTSKMGAPVVSLTDVGKSASLLPSAQAVLPLNDANLTSKMVSDVQISCAQTGQNDSICIEVEDNSKINDKLHSKDNEFMDGRSGDISIDAKGGTQSSADCLQATADTDDEFKSDENYRRKADIHSTDQGGSNAASECLTNTKFIPNRKFTSSRFWTDQETTALIHATFYPHKARSVSSVYWRFLANGFTSRSKHAVIHRFRYLQSKNVLPSDIHLFISDNTAKPANENIDSAPPITHQSSALPIGFLQSKEHSERSGSSLSQGNSVATSNTLSAPLVSEQPYLSEEVPESSHHLSNGWPPSYASSEPPVIASSSQAQSSVPLAPVKISPHESNESPLLNEFVRPQPPPHPPTEMFSMDPVSGNLPECDGSAAIRSVPNSPAAHSSVRNSHAKVSSASMMRGGPLSPKPSTKHTATAAFENFPVFGRSNSHENLFLRDNPPSHANAPASPNLSNPNCSSSIDKSRPPRDLRCVVPPSPPGLHNSKTLSLRDGSSNKPHELDDSRAGKNLPVFKGDVDKRLNAEAPHLPAVPSVSATPMVPTASPALLTPNTFAGLCASNHTPTKSTNSVALSSYPIRPDLPSSSPACPITSSPVRPVTSSSPARPVTSSSPTRPVTSSHTRPVAPSSTTRPVAPSSPIRPFTPSSALVAPSVTRPVTPSSATCFAVRPPACPVTSFSPARPMAASFTARPITRSAPARPVVISSPIRPVIPSSPARCVAPLSSVLPPTISSSSALLISGCPSVPVKSSDCNEPTKSRVYLEVFGDSESVEPITRIARRSLDASLHNNESTSCDKSNGDCKPAAATTDSATAEINKPADYEHPQSAVPMGQSCSNASEMFSEPIARTEHDSMTRRSVTSKEKLKVCDANALVSTADHGTLVSPSKENSCLEKSVSDKTTSMPLVHDEANAPTKPGKAAHSNHLSRRRVSRLEMHSDDEPAFNKKLHPVLRLRRVTRKYSPQRVKRKSFEREAHTIRKGKSTYRKTGDIEALLESNGKIMACTPVALFRLGRENLDAARNDSFDIEKQENSQSSSSGKNASSINDNSCDSNVCNVGDYGRNARRAKRSRTERDAILDKAKNLSSEEASKSDSPEPMAHSGGSDVVMRETSASFSGESQGAQGAAVYCGTSSPQPRISSGLHLRASFDASNDGMFVSDEGYTSATNGHSLKPSDEDCRGASPEVKIAYSGEVEQLISSTFYDYLSSDGDSDISDMAIDARPMCEVSWHTS